MKTALLVGCALVCGAVILSATEPRLPSRITFKSGNGISGEIKLSKADKITVSGESLMADMRTGRTMYTGGATLEIASPGVAPVVVKADEIVVERSPK